MLTTYKTKLITKAQLTHDTYLYCFKLVNPSTISFIPGQYLIALVPQENGEIARRLYSIASPNTLTNEFELLIKLIPQGCASCYFEKLQIGNKVNFQGPAGMFTLRKSQRDKIFMVTGTGYAPVRSMLLSMKEAGKWKMGIETGQEDRKKKIDQIPTSINQSPNPLPNPASTFYLFLGFPYYKDVFLFDELKNLQSSILNLKSYICLSREQNLDMIPEENRKYFLLGRVTNGFDKLIVEAGRKKIGIEASQEARNGKLDWQNPSSINQLPNTLLNQISNFDFYLCSGRDIVESLKQYLYQKGAPKEQVYFEKF